MKYSLRSLLIVGILSPPLLAGLLVAGARLAAAFRAGRETEWEELAGPGTITSFDQPTGCTLDVESDEAE